MKFYWGNHFEFFCESHQVQLIDICNISRLYYLYLSGYRIAYFVARPFDIFASYIGTCLKKTDLLNVVDQEGHIASQKKEGHIIPYILNTISRMGA
jgi:hypothetical protein